MDYMQLMVYLTDVNQETHCFSLSPESANAPILNTAGQLDRNGIVDCHGWLVQWYCFILLFSIQQLSELQNTSVKLYRHIMVTVLVRFREIVPSYHLNSSTITRIRKHENFAVTSTTRQEYFCRPSNLNGMRVQLLKVFLNNWSGLD